MSILVLCPTRGRPTAAIELQNSFNSTKTEVHTNLLFVVDADDPDLEQYEHLDDKGEIEIYVVPADEGGTMVKALNIAAVEMALNSDILGFVGDDHRFRTNGWDRRIADTMERMGGGIIYGNDLAQRQNLPTQVFMPGAVVEALGWMGLPTCHHLYIDNVWLVLGEGIGVEYLPDVVIEHLHPAYGKAEWDEGHTRVNSREMYDHDGEAFRFWLKNYADTDIQTAREALG